MGWYLDKLEGSDMLPMGGYGVVRREPKVAEPMPTEFFPPRQVVIASEEGETETNLAEAIRWAGEEAVMRACGKREEAWLRFDCGDPDYYVVLRF